MPRRPLTDAELAATRERITDVATTLFSEHGYEGVTLRAIASALGISPMTPYRYFADKAALFAQVRTRAFERFAEEQEAVGRARSPSERLRLLGRAYVQFAIRAPDAYRIMFELRQAEHESAQVRAASARAFAPLLAATRDAVATGELEGDPLTLAHLLWATTHGLVTLELAGKLSLGRDLVSLSEEVMSSFQPRRNAP